MSEAKSVRAVIPVIMENLHLTETDAHVILPIIIGGNMTVGAITLVSGLSKTKVERSLKRLIERGLVAEVKGVVPVYRALPLSLALSDLFTGTITQLDELVDKIAGTIDEGLAAMDSANTEMRDARRERMSLLHSAFESYERNVLEHIRLQLQNMFDSSQQVLSSFFVSLESTVKGLESQLDIDLGEELQSLQHELDAVYSEISSLLARFSEEFDIELDEAMGASTEYMQRLTIRAGTLVEQVRESLQSVLSLLEERLQSLLSETLKSVSTRSTASANRAVETLQSASSELKSAVDDMISSLSDLYVRTREILAQSIQDARSQNEEHAALISSRIREAAETAGLLRRDVDAWKAEVSALIESAANTINTHLQQLSANDASYLNTVENVITSHLEKVSAAVSEEYKGVRNVLSTIRDEVTGHLARSRSEVVQLLQKQNEADLARVEQARQKLLSELEQGVDKTRNTLRKQIQAAARDVESVLHTETGELRSLLENMDSRVQSAFTSVISAAKTKSKSILSEAEELAQAFEGSLQVQLAEILNEFSSKFEQQVQETKALFETINSKLDERFAEGVSTVKSHVERVETEIEEALADQISRIDRQTQDIRQEFHAQVEEITQQFISLVQGLEASFNGFLTNQTMEARDMIQSTHTSFRAAVRREMSSLREDSLKLQQEYASTMAQRLEELIASVAAAKRAMEELAASRQEQVSNGLRHTLGLIGQTLDGIEQGLEEIRGGTFKQISDSLLQMAREFDASVESATAIVTERLTGAQKTVLTTLRRGVTSAKNTTEAFFSEETGARQKMLAEASKKLDALSAVLSSELSEKLDAHAVALGDRESELVRLRNALREESLSAIRERRSEAAESIEGAIAWVDSTMNNIASSLEATGDSLDNGISVVEHQLVKASSSISKEVLDKSSEQINRIESVFLDLLKQIQTSYGERVTEFSEEGLEQVARSLEGIEAFRSECATLLKEVEESTPLSVDEVNSEIAGRLDAIASEMSSAVDGLLSEHKTATVQLKSTLQESRDRMIETIKGSVSTANVGVSTHFESAGLALKTRLSSDIYSVLEELRNELATQGEILAAAVSESTKMVGDAMTELRDKRAEILSELESEFDRSLKNWLSSARDELGTLKTSMDGTVERLRAVTKNTLDVVRAVATASHLIAESSRVSTWYLTGASETCAHIMDMAARATSSIVISVPDPSCLKVRRLSKAKKATRRVLILPPPEDPEAKFKPPAGWRVWYVESPPYLAVRDDEEIVVGGIGDADTPFAVVSVDRAFLKMYHDILGPQLVSLGKREG